MAGEEVPPPSHGDREDASSLPLGAAGLTDVRDPLPAEIRDPSFSAAVRGYDRHAVDRYVEQVNRLIAELQVSGSPRAAVRHALDRVGEQTSGILQRARETAEEIIASAREEAEETTRRAKAEAHDILGGAEGQASEVTSRATADANELVQSAEARAEARLREAAEEAERIKAAGAQDAQTRMQTAGEEIAALRRQAEARLGALEDDMRRVSEARQALLADAGALAARLAQVVADAEAAEPLPPHAQIPETQAPAATAASKARTAEPAPGDRADRSTGAAEEPQT